MEKLVAEEDPDILLFGCKFPDFPLIEIEKVFAIWEFRIELMKLMTTSNRNFIEISLRLAFCRFSSFVKVFFFVESQRFACRINATSDLKTGIKAIEKKKKCWYKLHSFIRCILTVICKFHFSLLPLSQIIGYFSVIYSVQFYTIMGMMMELYINHSIYCYMLHTSHK